MAIDAPRAKAPPISEKAEKKIFGRKKPSVKGYLKALARVKETEKIIRHQASSRATTPKRVLVKIPLALYSLIIITVAAGAVAEAIAPKSKER